MIYRLRILQGGWPFLRAAKKLYLENYFEVKASSIEEAKEKALLLWFEAFPITHPETGNVITTKSYGILEPCIYDLDDAADSKALNKLRQK